MVLTFRETASQWKS